MMENLESFLRTAAEADMVSWSSQVSAAQHSGYPLPRLRVPFSTLNYYRLAISVIAI